MSYNVDRCCYLTGKLSIKRGDAAKLARKFKDKLPESSWVERIADAADGESDQTLVEIIPFWDGEFSGWAYHEGILKECLAATTGSADLLLVWEGGDSQTGLRVAESKVEEKKVKTILED